MYDLSQSENSYKRGAVIGTLAEGSVHKALKSIIDPNTEHHEVSILGYVADIFNENGITEIQTRSFRRLLPKLERFTEKYNVRIVSPVVREKLTVKVEKSTGDVSKPRKSPKKESVAGLARELYDIASYIKSGRITVTAFEISAIEYRFYSGKKRGDVIDRELIEVLSQINLATEKDYEEVFLPKDLPRIFTAADYRRATRLPSRTAYYGIKLMEALGIIRRKDKMGRSYTYEH